MLQIHARFRPAASRGNVLADIQGYDPATGTARYYTQDHLGSTRTLQSQAKATLARFDYDPYGSPTYHDGASATRTYTGHDLDPVTGMYFAPYRYYAPGLARWGAQDPLGFADGPNLYSYVANNPIAYFDLLGLQASEDGWCQILDNPRGSFPNTAGGNTALLQKPGYTTERYQGGQKIVEKAEEKTKESLITLLFLAVGEFLGGFFGGAAAEAGGGSTTSAVIRGNLPAAADSFGECVSMCDLKKLSRGMIEQLKESGLDIHELKKYLKGTDIYRGAKGNLFQVPLNPGKEACPDPLGINIHDYI